MILKLNRDLSDNKLEGYIPYKLYKLENLKDL